MEINEFVNTLKRDNLEPNKIEAITSIDSSLLVIAGPGAGKNLSWIVSLVLKGTPEENIIVATFSEKAAKF